MHVVLDGGEAASCALANAYLADHRTTADSWYLCDVCHANRIACLPYTVHMSLYYMQLLPGQDPLKLQMLSFLDVFVSIATFFNSFVCQG